MRNGPTAQDTRLAELRHIRAGVDPAAFINPKTVAYAKAIMGQLKKMKPSYEPKPDIPSNVGGLIKHLFLQLGNRRAYSQIHNLLGNMSGVGSGFPSQDSELGDLARAYALKINQADAVAIGMVLLRSARRPNAALKLSMWAQKNLDIDHLTPDTDDVEAPNAGAEFERMVKTMNGFAGRAIHELGKENALYFAYSVAEDINWHALNRTGVLGAGQPGAPIAEDVDNRLLDLVQQRIDYGVEDAAVYIVALLRLAGLRGAALAVKRYTLKNFRDYFEV